MVDISPLIGRTSRVSAAAFIGRTSAPDQPDPVTTSLIDKNSLQLAVVSNQIQGMAAQMNSLAGSLQVIANSLATSQAIDRQKEQQEQILQARLAEAKLREGQESAIEAKISAKTVEPAQRLSANASFTLGRLGQGFAVLLGGWLLAEGVKYIKGLDDQLGKRLNQIKNIVLNGFSIITNIFSSILNALNILRNGFNGIGQKLNDLGISGLFTKPFDQFIKFITNAAKSAVEQIQKLPGLGGLFGIETTNTNQSNSSESEASSAESNQQSALTTSTDRKDGSLISTPTETMMGDKVNKNQMTTESSKGTFDNIMGSVNQNFFGQTPEQKTETSETTTKPQQTMFGKLVKQSSDMKRVELDPNVPAQYGETTLKAEDIPAETEGVSQHVSMEKNISQSDQIFKNGISFLEMGFSVNQIKSYAESEKYVEKMGILPIDKMFTPVKKDQDLAQKVGPAPEPPLNVIPIPMVDQGSQAQPQSVPVAVGGINNAPSFPTGNPDNIYLLSAYSNFNVVPV